MNKVFEVIEHNVDLCVVGGGLSGMCAAISAARHGMSVAIMQDRPLFGGNASSEIRMWVCGAHGKDNRETGIIEEIALENLYRNPYRTWPIWDTILFEKIKDEENIITILNCSCNDLEMDKSEIKSILGWQTTTQKWHKVHAKYFADCSGDSILAPLSGAEFRVGREARDEFNESIAPDVSDRKTMGMSCLIQGRKMNNKRTFIPPVWANKYTKEDLPYRLPDMNSPKENFWYMELGGKKDSIADTEEIRDELLKVAMGIWDYVKNSGDMNTDDWELDFLGFLPGKRESRRYVGDYILTQNDVENEGRFEDVVAYGGWTMDDHNPGGIETKEVPTIYNPAPSPFGIPYRCLYSKNISNLFFAGRNISVTHSAMSATRVMATCATLGQAVGTAAYIANKYAISPRGVYEQKIKELQQTLIYDDCYLPFTKTEIPAIMEKTKIIIDGVSNPERLINGVERDFDKNGVSVKVGESILLDFEKEEKIKSLRIVLDSDLNRETVGGSDYLPDKTTICNVPIEMEAVHMPDAMAKNMHVQAMDEKGQWYDVYAISNNRKRLLIIPCDCKTKKLRIVFDDVWSGDNAKLFSLSVLDRENN